MRAVGVGSYGGPEVLSVVDLPDPEPGPGEVRIRVTAAAVNPVDLSVRAGNAAAVVGDTPFPLVLGWDAAGVVDAVGDGVDTVAVGDRVIAMSLWFATKAGTHAELVVLPVDAVAPAPVGIDDDAASTIPLNGLTAWSALFVAKLEPGDGLIVTGAAGGVGGYLVELGAARGLQVVGVGRASDAEAITGFGAVRAVADIAAAGQASVVVDTTGDADAALAAVAPGGRLLCPAGTPKGEVPEGITAKRIGVRTDAAALAELSAMAADGRLTMRVADVLGFDQAAEAHRKLAAGGLRGRVVLRP